MTEAVSRKLAIIGSGNMGNAIARLFVTNGWHVVLVDPMDDSRARSRERLQVLLTNTAGTQLEWEADLEAASSAGLIIEAAPENKALKQAIFKQLEACCAPSTIIATNTSGLSINELATGLAHPERFVGAHFFTPADIIPLVEVIAGDHTATSTSEHVMQILREIGKLPVLVRKDIPGFIANRLQHALAREAMSLLEKGIASAKDIDTVAKWSLGIRLSLTGPLEQRDINGLDVHHAIASYLYTDLENRVTPSKVLGDKVAQGHFGVKTGQGFYDWTTPERQTALREKDAALRDLVSFLEARKPEKH
jgi:3-hydroxyacyl-CoA dehydrogenase